MDLLCPCTMDSAPEPSWTLMDGVGGVIEAGVSALHASRPVRAAAATAATLTRLSSTSVRWCRITSSARRIGRPPLDIRAGSAPTIHACGACPIQHFILAYRGHMRRRGSYRLHRVRADTTSTNRRLRTRHAALRRAGE